MQQIIEEGYHPQLGPRALKRAIEKQLTQPIAIKLAESCSTTTTLINVYRQGDHIVPDIHPLTPVARADSGYSDQPQTLIDNCHRLVNWLGLQLTKVKPDGGFVF